MYKILFFYECLCAACIVNYSKYLTQLINFEFYKPDIKYSSHQNKLSLD